MVLRNTRRALISRADELDTVAVVRDRLTVTVSRFDLAGTGGEPCWCFITAGMRALHQEEIVIILKCLPDEVEYPLDILEFLRHLFRLATRGTFVREGSFTEVTVGDDGAPFLGDPRNTGFVFSSYMGQFVTGLPLPVPPYLFGILTRGPEIEWAKYFPTRLLLRLV